MADKTKLSLIMGARNGALEEREENDFYATDPQALNLFLDKFRKDGERLSHNVWEPACGSGCLSDLLTDKGYNVYATDIINRNSKQFNGIFDFLSEKVKWNGDILTNPPFSFAKSFILQALDNVDFGSKVVMFLKVQFLEGKDRYENIFKDNPPKYVYVHSRRQKTAKGGDLSRTKSPTQCYCWFVWQKGFKGETILRWI